MNRALRIAGWIVLGALGLIVYLAMGYVVIVIGSYPG